MQLECAVLTSSHFHTDMKNTLQGDYRQLFLLRALVKPYTLLRCIRMDFEKTINHYKFTPFIEEAFFSDLTDSELNINWLTLGISKYWYKGIKWRTFHLLDIAFCFAMMAL